MLKKANAQISFTDSDVLCGHLLAQDSFYSKMSRHGHGWFRDENYIKMYAASGRGRPSVPPSLLAGALILQNYDGISDRELADRLTYDLRYKVALRLPVDFSGVDPSTFSVFRARLISHQLEGVEFERSLQRARASGLLDDKEAQAVDSMPILGAAAVQDSYTLMRTCIEKILREIDAERRDGEGRQGFQYPFRREKYLSLKRGKPDIDWDNDAQKHAYLAELMADARSLLQAIDDSGMKDSKLVAAQCELLRAIVAQDIQPIGIATHIAVHVGLLATAGLGHLALPLSLDSALARPVIVRFLVKKVTNDRILSTNDPEMRHGHKSKSKLFDGYKGHFAVGVDSELVIGVEITPANVADNKLLVPMVAEIQLRGFFPGKIYGDGAYGSADCRAEMEARGVEMVSKLPARPAGRRYPKSIFTINLQEKTVSCPAGHETSKHTLRKDDQGRLAPNFQFPPELCSGCPLRELCIPPSARNREIQLHFHEDQLQKARAQNAAPEFRQDYKKRLVVERVQSRLKSYSLKIARYFGVRKVKLQAYFTAAANNFWRVTSGLDKMPT